MIRGVHTMFYSSDAAGLRAFLRDKLGMPATDIGEGWLIFQLPPAELAAPPEVEPPKSFPAISFLIAQSENTGESVADEAWNQLRDP